MFNFAFRELYPGGKHHLHQCDRLSVRLFLSGRDGERKCCSVPCNAHSVTAFSLLYPVRSCYVCRNVASVRCGRFGLCDVSPCIREVLVSKSALLP